MSGAADDDSAPSNSTPQSPEGAEGAPDVTVAESKPDTPGSQEDATPRSESKNETPTEQPSETVEPAKEEAVEPAKEESNDESKTEVGDGPGEEAEPQPTGGEGEQNTSEGPASAVEDRKGDPAPETGETELAQQDDAKSCGEDNEAPASNENENVKQDDSKQADEPRKEDDEADGVAVTDESAKDEGNAAEDGSEDKMKAENECSDATEPGTEEAVNTNANNDVAGGTPHNAEAEASKDVPEIDTQEMKVNDDDNIPETKAPTLDAPKTESLANEDATLESVENKQGESAEENPEFNKQDEGATVAAPSNSAENTNVELSELDSLKVENERLGKRVKELENEIEGIREGRKEGMKIQADYLARELSQQQDTEKYLREKLAEVLQEKEESERRVKDLQLRLKRFAKDDQAKDARIAKLEKELREVTHEIQILENMLDADTLRSLQERRAKGNVNGPSGTGTGTNKGTAQHPPPPQSKTCIIL